MIRFLAGPTRATSIGTSRCLERSSTAPRKLGTSNRSGACFGPAFRSSVHEGRFRRNCPGVSPRVRQLARIADELTQRVREGEPAFFMGDMNDAWHPQRILARAGFVSCFAALGMQSPPTFQCYPTANVQPGERTITEAIDLIVANKHARAIAASVPQCYAEDLAPSDHWPVQAIYQLDESS